MTAIENGIFTKTTKDRLLNLEANQSDLNKKQLKEIASGKNLEEIKENSSERKKFKRVALGGQVVIAFELFKVQK